MGRGNTGIHTRVCPVGGHRYRYSNWMRRMVLPDGRIKGSRDARRRFAVYLDGTERWTDTHVLACEKRQREGKPLLKGLDE